MALEDKVKEIIRQESRLQLIYTRPIRLTLSQQRIYREDYKGVL